MLAKLSDVLEMARRDNYAIGSFNTPNFECLSAVLNCAEKLNVPVIIAHAELHEEVAPLAEIGPVMVFMANRAKVPVCVHLDHCEHLDYLQKALEIGFTSVMYDGSLLSYEENVSNTKKAVEIAKRVGADVEAEIGILGGREAGANVNDHIEDLYTDPDLAKRFVDETKIDALAASFGTAHGIYNVEPKLDFDRIKKIKALVDIPLVMHGGSGVSHDDYINAINCGVRKINYYSYMAREGVLAAKNLLESKEVTFFHDIALAASRAMEEDVMKSMKVFYKCNEI